MAVVGAGGGKTADPARAVADAPALICPTLASTDAPCSALSLIDSQAGVIEGFRFDNRHPLLVPVDTEVVARAPKRRLVGGPGDARAPWFEPRTVRASGRHNVVGGLPAHTGTALARFCYEILLAEGPAVCDAVEAGATTLALERVVEANTRLSGPGFESGGLAVAHALHNGLSGSPGRHACIHGEKVAFGLRTQLVLEGRPTTEIEQILRLSHRLGLPISLARGVDGGSDEQPRRIAERSLIPGASSHNEPFPISPEGVISVLRAADRMGRRLL